MGFTFLHEVIAESMWRAMGWVCDERANAVINHLEKRLQKKKYKVVAIHADKNDERRPVQPHPMEASSVGWPNRGNVWDNCQGLGGYRKIGWARERRCALADKTQVVTFALDSVKPSTVHRKEKEEGKGKGVNGKTPRNLGPADTTIHTRKEEPTIQLCGDSEVASRWINVNILWDRVNFKKNLYS